MRSIHPVPRQVWQEVFDADPTALPFQGPRWMDGMTSTGRFTDESLLFVTPTGRIVLPLAGSRMAPFIDGAASLPRGHGVGGLVSDRALTSSAVQEVLQSLSRTRFSRITVRPNPVSIAHVALAQLRWRAQARAAHVLDLAGGVSEVFERMQPRKRSALRQSLRSALEVESGNSPRLVDAFHDCYLRWCEHKGRALGVPARLARWIGRRLEPHWKFTHAAAAMGDTLRIYVASLHGRPVAASILLLSRHSAAYWRGASDLDSARANDLLQLHMIRDACAAGCAFYHMGESGGVQGLVDYKERLGARRHDYTEYILDRAPIASVFNVVDRGYRRASSLLRA